MMTKKVTLIGVAGGSGSGKTTVAQSLRERLGRDICSILYQDSYYIDQSQHFDRDGGAVNFDHPSAIDFDFMAEHLVLLSQGKPIDVPFYDFASHSRLYKTTPLEPKNYVIVDGILIFSQPRIRKLLDQKIYVDAMEGIRYERRLNRDVKERGRTPDGVREQFFKQVKPMHDEFVETSKQYANYIIENNSSLDHLTEQFDEIIERCQTPFT